MPGFTDPRKHFLNHPFVNLTIVAIPPAAFSSRPLLLGNPNVPAREPSIPCVALSGHIIRGDDETHIEPPGFGERTQTLSVHRPEFLLTYLIMDNTLVPGRISRNLLITKLFPVHLSLHRYRPGVGNQLAASLSDVCYQILGICTAEGTRLVLNRHMFGDGVRRINANGLCCDWS